MRSDDALGFASANERPERTEDEVEYEHSPESLNALAEATDADGNVSPEALNAFAEAAVRVEKPSWGERQLGYLAQLPAVTEDGVGRLGDVNETARGWYDRASSKPWQNAQQAAADEDPDAAARRRMSPPEAAIQSVFQGAAGLAGLPFAVGRTSQSDEILRAASEGSFTFKNVPASPQFISRILAKEYPNYVTPEVEDETSVRIAALNVLGTDENVRKRVENPVLARAETALGAVPGIVKETLREPVDLLGGVAQGDPGRVSENAAPLVDLMGLGMAARGRKLLTAGASPVAERAVRALRHDAPAAVVEQLDAIENAPFSRGYARNPNPPAPDVSDLAAPPVTFGMMKDAIARLESSSPAELPGGVRVPDAVRRESMAYAADDLTPGAKPSNVGNLPPKPSVPPGDFMVDLPARVVDEVDILPDAPVGGYTNFRKREIDLPPAPTPGSEEAAGYLGRLYARAREIGGPHAAAAELFADPGFRQYADQLTPERIRAGIANPASLAEDGEFISALTLRNRQRVVEEFVRNAGKAPDELTPTGTRHSFLGRGGDNTGPIRRGVGAAKLEVSGEWARIPEWDTRFPAASRGHWIKRRDLHRLDQVLGGRSTVFSKWESWIKKNKVVRNPKSHIHAAADDSTVQFMDGGSVDSIPRAIRGLNGRGDSLDDVLGPEFIRRYALGDYISEDQIGQGVAATSRVAALRAARTGNLDSLRQIVNEESIRALREKSAKGPAKKPGAMRRGLDKYDAAAQRLWILRDYGHRYAFFKRDIERRLGLEVNGSHKFTPEQARSLAAKIKESDLLDAAAEVADRKGFDYENLPQWAVASRAVGIEPFAGYKISSSKAFYDWIAENPAKAKAVLELVKSGREFREEAMARQQARRIGRSTMGFPDKLADVGERAVYDIPKLLPTSTVGLGESPLPNTDDLERGRFGLVGNVYDGISILFFGQYPDGRLVTDPTLSPEEQMLNRFVVAGDMSGIPHWALMAIVERAVAPREDAPGSGRLSFPDPWGQYGPREKRVLERTWSLWGSTKRALGTLKWAPRAEPQTYPRAVREAKGKKRTLSRSYATAVSPGE